MSLEPEHREAVCHSLPPDPREHAEVGRPDPGNGLNSVALHTNRAFSPIGVEWGLLLLSAPFSGLWAGWEVADPICLVSSYPQGRIVWPSSQGLGKQTSTQYVPTLT